MIRFLLFLLLSVTGLASPAWAQLSFSLRTGDAAANTQSMPIDSNNCANAGPRAMYVGGIIDDHQHRREHERPWQRLFPRRRPAYLSVRWLARSRPKHRRLLVRRLWLHG